MPTPAHDRGGSISIRPGAVQPFERSLIWTGAVAMTGVAIGSHAVAAWLLAVAVVAGLSHGAGDMERGRRAFADSADRWWLPFLVRYLGLVAAMLAAWTLMPALVLAIFLGLSALHFGEQDAGDAHGAPSLAAILAHGGAVVVVPSVAHPDVIRGLFAILIGEGADALQKLLAGPVALLWSASVAAVAMGVRQNRREWPALIHLLLVCLLFAAATPLVAFALYFALLLTPRALAGQRAQGGGSVVSVRTVGVTALACLLGLGIYLTGPHLAFDAGIVRTSFVLLSALTVPHMALDHGLLRSTRRRAVMVGRANAR